VGCGVWGLGSGVDSREIRVQGLRQRLRLWTASRGFGPMVYGLRFRGSGVWGLGFGVWGLGFGIWYRGLKFEVWGLGFGFGIGFWSLGFWVWGSV